MATASYNTALKRILVYEGGNVDDPHDPGGRTSRGVTQRVYSAWRKQHGHADQDVYKMTSDELGAIYRLQYWDAIQGDKLPAGVDLVVFDGAVNSGPKQAIKWLQAAINARGQVPPLTVDGVLGQVTLAAAEGNTDHDRLVAEIGARRLGFLHSLSNWGRYGKGWGARVANVTAAGEALATGSIGPAPVTVAHIGGAQKADVAQVSGSAMPIAGFASGTSAVAVLAGAADAIQGAATQLQPLVDLSGTFKLLFTGLTVVGIGITLYAAWKNHFAAQAISGEARAEPPAGEAMTAHAEPDAAEALPQGPGMPGRRRRAARKPRVK